MDKEGWRCSPRSTWTSPAKPHRTCPRVDDQTLIGDQPTAGVPQAYTAPQARQASAADPDVGSRNRPLGKSGEGLVRVAGERCDVLPWLRRRPPTNMKCRP